jgi:hypothetical protein
MKKALSVFTGVFLIAVTLAMTGLQAQAAGSSANLSWSPPTQYTDGSALPSSDIATYTVTWTGRGTMNGSKTVTGTSTTINIPCDQASFTVSVTTTGSALYPNTTSDPTGQVGYATGVTCRPNAPSGLTAS